MKKIFILAVFIAVVGVLCAVFFTRADRQSGSDEKPWTVGENVSAESRTEETSRAPYTDAVEAFSDYINLRLREDYAILSTENGVRYASDALQKAILGVYIYDVDADDAQELTVVRNEADGVYLDVYEFKNAEVQRADSIKLVLDPMEKTDFSLALADFAHISARMTIFPDGAYRYFCLTVEQQNMPQALDEDAAEASAAPDAESTKAPAAQSRAGDYNAYTVVLQYSKEKLAAKKSFRLRQRGFELSLMCTDNVTLLYRFPAAETAKYNDLPMAFQLEFEKIGLKAPQITVQNDALAAYKVSPVASAQTVFSIDGTDKDAAIAENGFLQSFVLPF